LISGGKPHFPAQAEQQGIAGGTVTVRISVTAEGAVADVAVLRADPPGVFEEVTVEAIRRWRFRPRLVNGVPSASIVEQKVTFKR
jgi:protein TonB